MLPEEAFITKNKISNRYKNRKKLHRPGIEPGPPAWQASILPLNHRCFNLLLPIFCINLEFQKHNNVSRVRKQDCRVRTLYLYQVGNK
jgi:hypothetical protein